MQSSRRGFLDLLPWRTALWCCAAWTPIAAEDGEAVSLTARADVLRQAGSAHPVATLWRQVGPKLGLPISPTDTESLWSAAERLAAGSGRDIRRTWWIAGGLPAQAAAGAPACPPPFRAVSGGFVMGDGLATLPPVLTDARASAAPLRVELRPALLVEQLGYRRYTGVARAFAPASIVWSASPSIDGAMDSVALGGWAPWLAATSADAGRGFPADSVFALALGVDGPVLARAVDAQRTDPVVRMLEHLLLKGATNDGTMADRLAGLSGTAQLALVPRPGMPGWFVDLPDTPAWHRAVIDPLTDRWGFGAPDADQRRSLSADGSPYPLIACGPRLKRWRIASEMQLLDAPDEAAPAWASAWAGKPMALHLATKPALSLAMFAASMGSAEDAKRAEPIRRCIASLLSTALGDADATAEAADGGVILSGRNAILACAGFAAILDLGRESLSSAIHDHQKRGSTDALQAALRDPQPRLLLDHRPEEPIDLPPGEPWGAISGRATGGPDLPMAVANPELGFGCTVWIDGAGSVNHSDGDRGEQLWRETRRLAALGRVPTDDDWAPVMRERRRLRFGPPVLNHPDNFEMAAMPAPWRMLSDKEKTSTEWDAAWVTEDRKSSVFLIATPIETDDAASREQIIGGVRAYLDGRWPDARTRRSECGVDGFAAVRLETTIPGKGGGGRSVRAILFANGWCWQLITVAEVGARISADSAITQVIERFGVRDRHLASPTLQTSRPVADLAHRTLPCIGNLAGSGWQVLDNPSKVNASASLALFHPATQTWAMLMAADLRGRPCSDEVLLAGMLAQMSQPYAEAVAGGTRRCRLADSPATETLFFRGSSPRARMLVRTAAVAGTALAVVVWRTDDLDPEDPPAKTLLEALHPAGTPARPLPEATGTFENTAADWYVAKSRWSDAWPWADAHARTHSSTAASLTRALRVLAAQERWPDALAWYRENAAHLADDDVDVAGWEPWLLAKSGKETEALPLYARLFDRGLQSHEDFALYVETLHKTSIEGAYAAFSRWPKLGGTTESRRLRATLMRADGREAEAAAWLREVGGSGAERDVLDQADALISIERFQEAHGVLDAMLKSTPGAQRGWRLMGIAEFKLGWHREALRSFEQALRIDPTDRAASEWQDAVRQALGRGDSDALRREIPAVAASADGDAGPAPAAAPAAGGVRWSVWEDRASWRSGGDLDHTRRRVVLLPDQDACENFSTLEIPVDTEAETLYVNGLWVTPPGGRRTDALRRDDCYVVDMAGSIAGGERLAKIPAPGLVPGCTLEWIYTTRRSRTDSWWFRIRPASQRPCDLVRFTFLGDAAAVAVATTGTWRESAREAGRLAYEAGPVAIARGSASVDPAGRDLASLTVGRAGTSWDELGKRYLKELDEVLAHDPRTAPLAREWLPGPPDPATDAGTLLRRVSERLSYSAVAFGPSARIPRRVSEVLDRNQGDCKDHSLLLWHLLRERGHRAFLALVDSGSGFVEAGVPSLEQFDHMVVCLAAADGSIERVLDGTADHQDPALLVPSGLGGATLLVLDPAGPRLAKAPAHNPSAITTDRRVRIGADGQLTVHERILFTAYYAEHFRNMLADRTPEERTERMLRLYSENALRVEGLSIGDLDDPNRPLAIELTWIPRMRLVAGEDGALTGLLPEQWSQWAFRATQEPGRTRALVIRWPTEVSSRTTVETPTGWTIASGAVTPADTDEWFAWDASRATDGSIGFRIREQIGDWPAGRFADWVQRSDLLIERTGMNLRMLRVAGAGSTP